MLPQQKTPSWIPIHYNFAEKKHSFKDETYQQLWEKVGLTYQDAQDLIAKGVHPREHELVTYLKVKGSFPINKNHLEELRKEYENWRDNLNAQVYLDSFYPHWKRAELTELDIGDRNLLGILDLTDFTNLETVECWGNKLTGLIIKENSRIKGINLSTNNLTSLVINNQPFLNWIGLYNNKQLTDLAITNNQNLSSLDCRGCYSIAKLELNNNPKLTNLNLESNSFNVINKHVESNARSNNLVNQQVKPKETHFNKPSFISDRKSPSGGNIKIELKWITNRNLTPFLDIKLQKIGSNETKTLNEWLALGRNESLEVKNSDWDKIQAARWKEINQQIDGWTTVDISNNKTFQETKIGDRLKVQLIPIDVNNNWINSECFFRLMDWEDFKENYGDGSFSDFLDITNANLLENYKRKEVIIDLIVKSKSNTQPRYEIKKIQESLRQKENQESNYIPYLITKQDLDDYGYNREIEVAQFSLGNNNIIESAQEWLDRNYPKALRKNIKELYIGKGQDHDIKGETKEILRGSLKLEGFINLEVLDCASQQLTSLDLSDCQNLTEITCYDNQLTNLPIELKRLPHPEKLTCLIISDNNYPPYDLSFLEPFINIEELYLNAKICGSINLFFGSLKHLRNNNEWLIIMELAENGSLKDFINNSSYTWREALNFMKQMTQGLSYLHCEGVIHCDLKSLNVLLTEGNIAKLSDFGISQIINKNKKGERKAAGTTRWMAPELLINNNQSNSFESDIYSLGIVFWELAAKNTVPFKDINDERFIITTYLRGEREEIPANAPVVLKEIIEGCWKEETEERTSLTETEIKLNEWEEIVKSNCQLQVQDNENQQLIKNLEEKLVKLSQESQSLQERLTEKNKLQEKTLELENQIQKLQTENENLQSQLRETQKQLQSVLNRSRPALPKKEVVLPSNIEQLSQSLSNLTMPMPQPSRLVNNLSTQPYNSQTHSNITNQFIPHRDYHGNHAVFQGFYMYKKQDTEEYYVWDNHQYKQVVWVNDQYGRGSWQYHQPQYQAQIQINPYHQ